MRRATAIFILVTVVLDVLALGIVIPVLPKLIESFLGGDTAQAASLYGLFMTLWALMQFIGSPIQGALSDHFGRRPVILLSNVGLGLDYFVMALSPTVWWLLVGRVLSGLTAASFSTAMAYIADVTPIEKRAGAFGLVGAAFGVGFILGPAVGGLLGHNDPRLPFWVAGGLSLVNACYGFFVLPESLSAERRSRFAWGRANPVGSLRLLRSHPELYGLAGTHFLYQVAHWVLPSSFVLYTGYRYGWDARTVGSMLALVGIANVIAQGFLIRRVVAAIGERRALVVGLLLGAIGMAGMGLAPVGFGFAVMVPMIALMGLFGPAAQALMTQRVPVHEQGQLQGALSSVQSITGLFAPFLFTESFAFAIRQHPAQLPGAPFLLAAATLLAAALLGWSVTRAHAPAPRPPDTLAPR